MSQAGTAAKAAMEEMAEIIVDALIDKAARGDVGAVMALAKLEREAVERVVEQRPSLSQLLWNEHQKRKAEQ